MRWAWGNGKRNKIKLLSTTSFGKNINTHIGFSKYVLESEVFKPLQKVQSPTTKLNKTLVVKVDLISSMASKEFISISRLGISSSMASTRPYLRAPN